MLCQCALSDQIAANGEDVMSKMFVFDREDFKVGLIGRIQRRIFKHEEDQVLLHGRYAEPQRQWSLI